MTQEPAVPLGPPPRKAHVRPVTRNIRRAYKTLFGLLILVFGGWAFLDAFRWPVLTDDQRILTVGFGLTAVLALVIYWFVDHPLRRELRLARRGAVAQAEIISIGRKHNRRATPVIAYAFHTGTGVRVEGSSTLPHRFPVDTLAAGMTIEVLYDAKKPQLNKPRLGLEYVEFGEGKKKVA